eukprot:g1807.t1
MAESRSVKARRRTGARGGGRKRRKVWGRADISLYRISFEQGRDFVRRLKLRSKKEWQEWGKSGQRPSNVPACPDQVYKGKGWVSWPDWMGYQYTNGDQNKGKSQMLPFTSARAIVRRLQLTSQKEWNEWSKSGQRPSNVPSHPEQVYKGKGWVSYPDWMGYQYTKGDETRGKSQMLPFTSARDIVRRLRLTSQKEWQEWRKSGQRPSNVPADPHKVYRGKGWVSLPDWMGYQYTEGDETRGKSQMLPFTSARDIVRRLQLTSQKEWQEWSKSGQRPSNVPALPSQVYKDKGWVSWPDWMGYTAKKVDGQMLPFTSARAIVRRLRLTSQKEWQEWSKSGQRPSNVPGCPDQVYKGKGWVSYPDWMGYQFDRAKRGREAMDKLNRKRKRRELANAPSSSSSSSPPLDICAICFEPLCPVTTEIGHLACVHTFHVDCLNGHARASATPATTSRRGVLLNCPLCRKRTRWLPPPPED